MGKCFILSGFEYFMLQVLNLKGWKGRASYWNTCFSFWKVKNLFTQSITETHLPLLLTTAIKKLHEQWKTEQEADILAMYMRTSNSSY